VIELLDKIEESRGLEVHEWNFWDILKHHLTNLLEWRRIYWKQRGTIKWVTNGDAGTNFFHANATIKHKQNFITTLDDNFGNVLSGHEEKAALLWEAYKQRLGTSEFSHIYFDLSSLLEPVENLSCLEEPFLKEEIEGIIRDLSLDKSPSHDGFNGEFLRKCWPTVSKEFQWRFFDENICLQSINSSHIVLIPKKNNSCKVGVLRPISLLNSSIKLLTKILATRLKVITGAIHLNKYGFIKERSIQDCIAWGFEYLHIYNYSKMELVILKLDFEKAFDKIEHEVILQIMQHKGFGMKWINWMRMIMGSGTSTILLNRVSGKVFHCRRGVRQGDPLSPLLFVLVGDLLQSIVNSAL
jgi:hypothetical protein